MNVRIILAITVLLAIVATSSWFLYRDDIRQALRPQADNLPDYQLDEFTYTSNDTDGRPQYTVKGEHMDHFPQGDRYIIDTVHIDSYSEGSLLWLADAKQAIIYGPSKTILLKDRTVVTYYGDGDSQPMVLVSSDVTVHTDTNTAHSDSPTKVTYTEGHISSEKGFTIDGKTRILTMQGGVFGEMQHD
jgi:lipopolysaccharide export system protein LptC